MTHRNLSVKRINEFLNAGKPCYLETSDRNIRIYQVRTVKGQFQIKAVSSDKWQNALQSSVICAY